MLYCRYNKVHTIGIKTAQVRESGDISGTPGVVLESETASVTLEEGVIVGTGAKLLGQIRIGARAKIGANSVVLKDIPAGEVWAGVPAKNISNLF